jgi:SAM-dependent methyltransferase
VKWITPGLQREALMQVEYVAFRDRSDRAKYIADRFGRFLAGNIIDVGCDKAFLRQLLPQLNYVGVDVAGNPDIKLNLEYVNNLPFDDAVFDCVVCSDVLEHLDNLYHIFAELVRVTKRYIILSLPNNWVNARRPIERGKGSFGHYGLPVHPPQDRHKWFFGFSEAMSFIRGQETKYPISIIEIHATEKPRPAIIRVFRRLMYPSQECYLNRYAHTLWVVFEKATRPT